jgi:hypothetical protein
VTGGQNGAASCKGYNAPPGASESTSTSTLFVFNGIQPTATVDEGHNWLNLVYGPLTLNRTAVGQTSSPPELMVAGPAVGSVTGAYSLPSTSPAISGGVVTAGTPTVDLYGSPRSGRNDIGAVQYTGVTVALVSVQPGSLSFGALQGTTSATQNLTVTNTGNGAFTGLTATIGGADAARFARNGGTCAATLNAGATCTIGIRFTAPAGTAGTNYAGTVAITGSVLVTGSPVSLTGSSQAPTFIASVSPGSLAFGNWATGTASSTQNITITNTGNSALAGLTVSAFAAPFSRVTGGTFPAGAGNCGTTLAVAAVCTVKVRYSPTTATTSTGTVTITATGATVTPSTVGLSGTGVATRSAVSISAPTPTITLPTGAVTGTGLVTFTNNAAVGGSQVNVTNIAVSGGSLTTYLFNVGALAGPDNCTGVALAPGASCTVTVRFTNFLSPRGTNRAGTVTFTDTGLASPQAATLTGFATP